MNETLEQQVTEDQSAEQAEPQAEITQATETQEPETQATEDEDSDIKDFLQTSGLSTEPDSSTEDSPDPRQALLSKVPEDIRGDIESLLTERETAREQERTQRSEGVRQRFRGRIDALRPFLMERGLSAEDAQLVQNTFNNHHNDVLQLSTEDSREPFTLAMIEAAAKQMPASEREKFKKERFGSADDFTKRLVSQARVGYVTEKQGKDQTAQALKDYKKYLEGKGLLTSSRTPRLDAQGAGGSGIPSLQQWREMTLEKRAEYRQKDPEIEFKIR